VLPAILPLWFTPPVNVKELSREFVNLLVDLDARFSPEAMQPAIALVRQHGFTLTDAKKLSERYLSWIDLVFGGTWSSEAATGSAVVIKDATGAPVGFASYGATGLRYYWLRAWENREDVGILGPVGIDPAQREPQLESALMTVTLVRMREAGFRFALIPAVTEPIFDRFVSLTGGKVVERFSMDRIAPDLRTTVMASGVGTNFQAVIDSIPEGLGLDIQGLVVNKPDAYSIERANLADIPVHVHVWDRETKSRERYDEELIEIVEDTEPELILMLGWMHLVSPDFFARLPQPLNIHPAFLPHDFSANEVTMPDGEVIPAFRGAHAIRDALNGGSKWYGATAHRVTADVDRGAILKREPLLLSEKDEASALAALHPVEHGVLIGAIRRILAER
jgi:phosphoribosylglycinamide formyltransferase 1